MKIKKILQVTFFAVGTFYMLKSYAHAELVRPHNQKLFLHEARTYTPPTLAQRQAWQEKYDFHLKNGIRCYNEAKDKAWYLPNLTDREKARYCYTSLSAVTLCTSACSACAAAIITLFTQYGLDAIDQYHYIENKLNWSRYHFDMCDHYHALMKQKG